jgi:hypothetical protein
VSNKLLFYDLQFNGWGIPVLLSASCLLQQFTEGNIEGTRRRGRRRRYSMHDLKEKRRYWKLK